MERLVSTVPCSIFRLLDLTVLRGLLVERLVSPVPCSIFRLRGRTVLRELLVERLERLAPEGWELKISRFFFPLPPQISFLLYLEVFSSKCGRGSRPWPRSARLGFSGSFCVSPAGEVNKKSEIPGRSSVEGGPAEGWPSKKMKNTRPTPKIERNEEKS